MLECYIAGIDSFAGGVFWASTRRAIVRLAEIHARTNSHAPTATTPAIDIHMIASATVTLVLLVKN